MFDFCKLDVYQKAKSFYILIKKHSFSKKFDRTTNDQLRRASFSIMLNIAEGSSRFRIRIEKISWLSQGEVHSNVRQLLNTFMRLLK